MLDIKITRTATPKAKPTDETKLGFGKKFSDHMFVMDYTEGEGWHDARIVPYGPFELDPATVVFHYAQEIFEGMKAYRTADDTVQLFRPDCNAKRFQDSADRLCIPKIPVEDYIQAVEALVDVDRDWVPHTDGASLYIRPFIFANDVGLGVHASTPSAFSISRMRKLLPFLEPRAFPSIMISPSTTATTGLMARAPPMNATVGEIRPPFFKYSRVSKSPMVWILCFCSCRMLTISSAVIPCFFSCRPYSTRICSPMVAFRLSTTKTLPS